MLKYNLSQINIISKKILVNLSKTDCIFLFGELGSGKTTFARSLINQLQEKNGVDKTEVPSPTFNLLYEYKMKSLKVMHYDLYRINNVSELDEIGFYDNLETEAVHFIEWPEIIPLKLINANFIIYFEIIDQYRLISIDDIDA